MNFNINNLIAFYKVVESGGFNKAAKKYNISQPALSASVNKLQEELGVKLIYRDGNKNILTAEGKTYFETAKKIISTIDENKTITIKIGARPAFATYILPSFICNFEKEIKDIDIKVETMASRYYRQALTDDIIDIAVDTHPHLTEYKEYTNIKIGEKYSYEFICNKETYEKLGKKDSLSIKDLTDYQIFFNDNDKTNIDLSNEEYNFIGQASNSVIKEKVLRGYGIGILSPNFFYHEINKEEVYVLNINDFEKIYIAIYATFKKEKSMIVSRLAEYISNLTINDNNRF